MATANRNCHCSLWETDPSSFLSQGLPRGYCGICERCGQSGHLRHAPAPVPSSGSWCDECFKIEVHRAPNIKTGAWSYNSATGEETTVPIEKLGPDILARLVGALVGACSSLVVGYEGGRWVDFYVQPNGLIEMSYGDERHNKWAYGSMGTEGAREAAICGLVADDIERIMRLCGEDLEYYSE